MEVGVAMCRRRLSMATWKHDVVRKYRRPHKSPEQNCKQWAWLLHIRCHDKSRQLC